MISQPNLCLRHLLFSMLFCFLLIMNACSASQMLMESQKPSKFTVGIQAPDGIVAKDNKIKFEIHRTETGNDLRVVFTLHAQGADSTRYLLKGGSVLDKNLYEVTIPNNQEKATLMLEVRKDAPAIPNEMLKVALLEVENDAYQIDLNNYEISFRITTSDLLVTNVNDAGKGSLRQAIVEANAFAGPDTIRFDSLEGPFGEPQTILLNRELPELTGSIKIDGYIQGQLWKAYGVTISGSERQRIFSVEKNAKVTIAHLTIADGKATNGGGVLSAGHLVVKGVTFVSNSAIENGGAVAILGGSFTAVNSTFTNNISGIAGGAVASLGGTSTMTNCTIVKNRSKIGAGLYDKGNLLLRNAIVAQNLEGNDCVSAGMFSSESTNNLIQSNDGCGLPISTEDPYLQDLGYYNGPTKTLPLKSGSPAINLGDINSAVDEKNKPLEWDQRGNGDPRFVAGYPDIGAFEHQRFPVLKVDTYEDTVLRGCTDAGKNDCSLRGAIALANVARTPQTITFDANVFAVSRTIKLLSPLPELEKNMTIDASGTDNIVIGGNAGNKIFKVKKGIEISFVGFNGLGASN